MHLLALALLPLCSASALSAAPFDRDPEALALRKVFDARQVTGASLKDDWNVDAQRRITGPVTVAPGQNAQQDPADRAASFPDGRIDALYVYYGVTLPRRGRLSIDFRVDQMPRDHNFMTLCSVGTPGNTKFWVRLGLDRRVSINVLSPREGITLTSDPVDLGKWHRLQWWYAPEGALLLIDGAIADYATDYCVPYAVEVGDAFYLGDQPWWDPDGRKGILYPLDNFVGLLDNLELANLK